MWGLIVSGDYLLTIPDTQYIWAQFFYGHNSFCFLIFFLFSHKIFWIQIYFAKCCHTQAQLTILT